MVGEEMYVDVFMNSYQEQMLRLALERHFDTERQNFSGRTFKIKTLALFFIDDISSYRRSNDGKNPYLLESFERLLREKLKELIAVLSDQEKEYRDYLEASLNDISACHAGYFAQDNSSSDEDVADEVDVILNGKKQLLSFKNEEGKPALCRFLFSKWTLKEGWDNPNVFTIAKLRSSGSEISKLQEVGRGLRLPVDECGNRISNQEFTLNYIVDFTESDFARKLVEQINNEVPTSVSIPFEKIQQIAERIGMDGNKLFAELLTKGYISGDYRVNPENRSRFLEEYPMFISGLEIGKVKDRNVRPINTVKIRKAQFEELRDLWTALNRNYTIWYDESLDSKVEAFFEDLFKSGNIFTEQVICSRRDIVSGNGIRMSSTMANGVQYSISQPLTYGVFLKRISGSTNIPVSVIHQSICKYVMMHGAIKNTCFNEQSVRTIIKAFSEWKLDTLQGHFKYKKTYTEVGATALTHADGSVRDEITQGRIGVKIKEGDPAAKYLYDTIAYDSPLELENIISELDRGLSGVAEVIVYGKIPRSSISIPTISGGTYSPDFMYVVKKLNGDKELNIVVETKDVENKTSLRKVEEARIKCAEVFFKNLSDQGYTVHFHTQLNNKRMLQIMKEVLN